MYSTGKPMYCSGVYCEEYDSDDFINFPITDRSRATKLFRNCGIEMGPDVLNGTGMVRYTTRQGFIFSMRIKLATPHHHLLHSMPMA